MIEPTAPDADYKMMTSPNEWPLWPMLPLKNAQLSTTQWPKHGVLMNRSTRDDTDLWFIEDKTIYDKIGGSDLRKVTPEELRELINAGWIVD